MQSKDSSKSPAMIFWSRRWILTSFVLCVLLLLGFVESQSINLGASGWVHGFSHPLEGWDHLLTMLAVGIWAAQMRGQAVWLLPLAFVSVMSLGGLAGAAGLSIPSAEGIILLSCAVFSILITRKIHFTNKVNVLIVAFFAFFHGFAHGQEISTSASLVSYTLGFMLATLLLHGAGILVAKIIVLAVSFFLTFMSSGVTQASVRTFSDAQGKTFVLNLANINVPLTEFQGAPPIINPQKYLAYLQVTDYFSIQEISCRNFNAFGLNDSNVVSVAASDSVQLPHTLVNNSTDHNQACWIKLRPHQNQTTYLFLLPKGYDTTDSKSVLPDFTSYYPDINNTPGTDLLSNGVGLTSPPASMLASHCDSNTSKSFPNSIKQAPSHLTETPSFSSSPTSCIIQLAVNFHQAAICLFAGNNLLLHPPKTDHPAVALFLNPLLPNFSPVTLDISHIHVFGIKPRVFVIQKPPPNPPPIMHL